MHALYNEKLKRRIKELVKDFFDDELDGIDKEIKKQFDKVYEMIDTKLKENSMIDQIGQKLEWKSATMFVAMDNGKKKRDGIKTKCYIGGEKFEYFAYPKLNNGKYIYWWCKEENGTMTLQQDFDEMHLAIDEVIKDIIGKVRNSIVKESERIRHWNEISSMLEVANLNTSNIEQYVSIRNEDEDEKDTSDNEE